MPTTTTETHRRICDWAWAHERQHARILSGLADPQGVEILTELCDEIASAMTRDIPSAKDAIELARVREALVAGIAIEAVRRWQAYQMAEINDTDVW